MPGFLLPSKKELDSESADLVRERLREELREHLQEAGMGGFVTAARRARRDGSDIAASLLSFREDSDLLYSCLAYAYLEGVRVVIEPELFRGLQRRHAAVKSMKSRRHHQA